MGLPALLGRSGHYCICRPMGFYRIGVIMGAIMCAIMGAIMGAIMVGRRE